MEKLSATRRKAIRSLSSPKGRKEEGAFITERTKNVLELLEGPFALRCVVATNAWFEEHRNLRLPEEKCIVATTADLERITTLSTPPDVVGVFALPSPDDHEKLTPDKLYIALDDIQDPGNLGTVLRIADWFGVDTVIASKTTVDVFNPKCIIASMGSICRVKVRYCNLEEELARAAENGFQLWGTFLDGESIYSLPESTEMKGIIVMGNEGRGISANVGRLVGKRISIPSFPPGHAGAESLNVAMATAITLAEFRRRELSLKR